MFGLEINRTQNRSTEWLKDLAVIGKESLELQQYINSRVEDQIGYYDSRSARNKFYYVLLRTIEIFLSASVAVVASINSNVKAGDLDWKSLIIAMIGAAITVVAGIMALNRYQEKWLSYRTTAEELKHELVMYLHRATSVYDSNKNNEALFVERFESLVSKENTNWTKFIRPEEKAK